MKREAARRGWWDLPVENGNLGRAEDVDVDVLSLEPNRTDLCGGNPAHRNVLDMLAHQADPSPLEHGAAASHLPLSLLPYSTMARAALKGGGRIPDGRTGAEPPPTRPPPPLAPLTRDFYAIFSTRLRPIFRACLVENYGCLLGSWLSTKLPTARALQTRPADSTRSFFLFYSKSWTIGMFHLTSLILFSEKYKYGNLKSCANKAS